MPGSGDDAQVLQQSSKPTGEDQRFSSEGLHLISILVHLLGFGIARGRLLFIRLVFCATVLRLLLSSWRRVPLLVMPLVVCRPGTLEAAARSEVPADRWVDGRCSCVQCDGYEPSII
jgi:hypothetical protein